MKEFCKDILYWFYFDATNVDNTGSYQYDLRPLKMVGRKDNFKTVPCAFNIENFMKSTIKKFSACMFHGL
jgi:hypothetical protein